MHPRRFHVHPQPTTQREHRLVLVKGVGEGLFANPQLVVAGREEHPCEALPQGGQGAGQMGQAIAHVAGHDQNV
jgi:hypothetical protein